MIGGPGWSAKVVQMFLSSAFYTIPCGAVPKKDDPFGRIIHNYSHKYNGWSINDALMDNSVAYIAFKERAALLQSVNYYIKLDMKDGYRQLPVHPSE